MTGTTGTAVTLDGVGVAEIGRTGVWGGGVGVAVASGTVVETDTVGVSGTTGVFVAVSVQAIITVITNKVISEKEQF